MTDEKLLQGGILQGEIDQIKKTIEGLKKPEDFLATIIETFNLTDNTKHELAPVANALYSQTKAIYQARLASKLAEYEAL